MGQPASKQKVQDVVKAKTTPTGEFVLLSAHSMESLIASMKSLEEIAATLDPDGLSQLGSQSRLRFHSKFRRGIYATNPEMLTSQLRMVPTEPSQPGAPLLVLLAPGNGCQSAGMLKPSLEEIPAARQIFEEVMFAFQSCSKSIDWSLLLGCQDPSTLTTFDQQALLFAHCMVMSNLMGKLGLKPDAVLGHSAGELICACASGALDIAQSCRLFLAKVGSMDAMTSMTSTDASEGSMAVANFGAAEISEFLESFNAHLPEEEKVLVAADNSSSCCTLTGLKASLSKLKASLPEELKLKASWKDLGLPRAYHHRELCKGAAEHFEQHGEEVPPGPAFSSRFFSTVKGGELSAAELTKDYWKRHTLEPVRFREATVEVLKAMGDSDRPIVFVELKAQNKHHILQAAQDLGMNQVHYQSLTKKKDEVEHLCEAIAKLWEWGFPLQCGEVFPARKFKPRHDLKHEPRTHFCRQRAFQLALRTAAPGMASPAASSQRSFANSKSESTDSTATVWSKELNHPILKQHLFSGKELVPAALILVALADAGYPDVQLKFMTSCYAHEGSAQVVLQVLDGHITVKSPDQQNHYSEGVVNPACTAPAADHWMQKWKEMSSSDQTQPSKHLLSAALLKRLSGLRFRPPASQLEEVDCEGHEGLQSLLQSGGLFFGRNLRLSGKVLLQNNDRLKSSFGLARVHYAEELEDYSPVLIDQAIQVSLGLCLHQLSEAEREKGAVPIQVEKFSVFRPKILAQYDWLHCVVEVKPKVIDSAICASFALIASDGTLVAAAHNLWGKLQSSKAVPLQELMWQIRPTDLPPAEPVKQKKFLAFCEDDSIMAQLMKKNQVAPDDVIIIGAEEQHKSVSLSIATALQRTRTSLEEIDAFIYEWTSGVDVNRLSEAAVAAADRKIRRQCAAFRELIIFVSTSPKDILVITKGSPQFAEQKSEVKHPGSGMFMAMTKSLVNEGQPGKGLLHCIELADTTAATIETLAKEITNPRQDTSELRICDGQAQRLELLPELVSYDSLLQQGCLKKASTASTYVILGGLKGESLSSLLLQFLAQRQHGDNIVVVGRSGPDEAFKVLQKKVVKEFGVRVIPIQADITEPNSLALALQKCGIKSKDVKGVLHGAACFDGDRMIHKVTDEQFDKTLAPKVRGSLEILATSQREEWSLDFFWYISSVVVALGNYGQVAYGGANAFQADLGTWQSWMQNKTKVQVINFTVLDDVGVMHGQQKMQKNLDETRGFPAINKATIYQALDATMRLGLPMVTVATFDRQKLATLALANDPCVASRFHTVMARFTGASTPRATSATSATSAAPSSAASSAESVASASVAPATAVAPASEPTSAAAPALPAAPARTVVAAPPVAAPVAASVAQREAFLQKIKDVMGVTELDMTKSLERQGLDSMTAIECRQQLKDAFRIDVELLELSERRLSDVLKKVGL